MQTLFLNFGDNVFTRVLGISLLRNFFLLFLFAFCVLALLSVNHSSDAFPSVRDMISFEALCLQVLNLYVEDMLS